MTKKRIIFISAAVLAVIICVTAIFMVQRNSAVRGDAEVPSLKPKILDEKLPEGKYYAYGDVNRPYYEVKGDQIRLCGVPYDTYKETAAPSPENENNISDDYWDNVKDRYNEEMNFRTFALAYGPTEGKFILLNHSPSDKEFNGGIALPLEDGNVILGFNPVTREERDLQRAKNEAEQVPYVLVKDNGLRKASAPMTFPDVYPAPQPDVPPDSMVITKGIRVAKPKDSFVFEGNNEETTSAETGSETPNSETTPDATLGSSGD
jgi:hypothetical protein